MRLLERRLAALLLAAALAACAPAPSLETSDGAKLPLASLEGRWLFVNYWAIWCKPCVEEVQELNALAASLPEARVIGFNFDNPEAAELRRQISDLDIRFPVVTSDPGKLFGAPERVSVLPTTLLVSPDGALVRKLIGPQTEASLTAALKQAMAAP